MSAAMKLLDEIFEQGINISEKDGNLKCSSVEPVSQELITRLRSNKSDILRIIKKRDRQKGKPYLSETGELRVPGILPPGSLLDTLLGLEASSEEIERHLDSIGTPHSWKCWQLIKPPRSIH